MNRRGFLTAALGGGALALPAWAQAPAAPTPGQPPSPAPPVAPASREWYRLRITNVAGGAIEQSGDRGSSWETLGHVTHPATAAAAGTPVLGIAAPGTVAGVTPESIQIRLPGLKGTLRSLRITGGSETPGPGLVVTDLPARAALFRLVAPPPGSAVLLDVAGKTGPLPPGYVPRAGDALQIVVSEPAPGSIATVTFENKAGGEVLLEVAGGVPRVVARVKQPLTGIGRYAGTDRAGAGRVVAWSPTAVIVSTAGTRRVLDMAGKEGEGRGGFVIQPAEPQLKGATHPDSQILIEALPEGGVKLPVARFFSLPFPPSTGDPLDPDQTRVEVRIDGGDWEALPDLKGPINAADMVKALAAALGEKRKVNTGITHVRLVSRAPGEAAFKRRLRLAAAPFVEAPQRGRVTITANVMGEGISFVTFHLDGRQQQLTNLQPYAWGWDTTTAVNGDHLVEIRGLDQSLAVVSTSVTRVVVDN